MNNISQGARANFSGQTLENWLEEYLQINNISFVKQFKYKALWFGSCLNKIDFLINNRIAIECKNQNVNGTADIKVYAEIWNAAKLVPCDIYILLCGGSWWDSPRGYNIFNSVKEMAMELSISKQLLVFRPDEFVKEVNKGILK